MEVIKRNQERVPFNEKRIESAIVRASQAAGKALPAPIIKQMLADTVLLLEEGTEEGVVDIEYIQDSIERVLAKSGYFEIAKKFIIYRHQHKNIREVASTVINYSDLMNGYLDRLDWRVKENSTVQYTLGGLILSNSGAVTANYWLSNIYDEEIAEAHRNCLIHLHDLSMLCGYCAGWSLKQLLEEGIKGVAGRNSSAPASHLSTICNQMVNYIGIMQNEWAGAQAFTSFDTYLAPFVRADGLTYKEVKQGIQSFVFGVNTPSRWGTQSPFTNITLDWQVPDDLRNLPAIVGGKEMDYTYGECQTEVDMINKAFLEIMNEGDSEGRGFQYPIPTYSITKEFDWSETENNRLLFEMTAKYGTPYFANYINSDMSPSDIRSMCCRLRLDLRELRRKNGGFFGSGESTGSVGVVTLNLPHIAYISKNEEEFWENLDHYMDIAARSLRIKREVITKLLDAGLYPYTKSYLGTFKNHFSTIGVVGGNELCQNASWLRKDLTQPDSQAFIKKMLIHMRNRLSDYQEQYQPDLYNLESTPAESTAYRFAKHDKLKYPDIITANDKGTPYYTNSTNLPVDFSDDVFDALDVQDIFQPLYTSGTVFHTYLGEKLPSWESAAKFIKSVCENYRLPYLTLSPTYSVCLQHGYITGEHNICPKCGRETEIYSRITGYYRPVQNWNDGKIQEFKDRREYQVNGHELKKNLGNLNNDIPITYNETLETLLFTTRTCPNCRIAVAHLNRAGIPYRMVDAEKETALTEFYKVLQAPTLICADHTRWDGVGKILQFADKTARAVI